ncbi:ddc0540a-90df-4bac-818e-b8bce764135d [Sclerotinia trifoliorum]|uniref:Ddc0540a-90df-4bac-818e-b8bce764135d n=1 Tax=Sclerotinia trifoliorum TaxID=28548 RepID=A0A8H2VT48_9HELO|nr:ddc0540a-90df-4bac-818e-b8bce764135d [Sclerotinia trifoliorum]
MVYLNTAQEWLTQSSLLLKAHPSTTRITTKYTILHASSSPHAPSTTHSTPSKPRLPKPSSSQPAPPRATLTITTFHPHSGVNLKYTTNKAAEVSRLIQIMGRLGKLMAGLPEEKEGLGEINMGEAPVGVEEEKGEEKEKEVGKQAQAQMQTAQTAGKGKKKKGKK